jgi:redox-sensing transcriptional repressor
MIATGSGRRSGPGRGGRRGAGVSDRITQRLCLYLRCLEELDRHGIETISSHRLAERFSFSSAQIRKDLATFGEFGVRGVGYSVDKLRKRLTRILGLDREQKVVIVGAGNLGMALADYGGFNEKGFRIVALFDVAPEKVGGATRKGVPILHFSRLGEVARREEARIAVVAVPGPAAQEVVDAAAAAGISAILNFAPARLRVPSAVSLRNVDLKVQMESLAYRLAASRRPSGPRRSPR